MAMTRAEHLLTVLAEECAEVAQRACKALRFGADEVQPGQGYTNAQRVGLEMADLLAVYGMLEREQAFPPAAELAALAADKRAKVEKFLELSRSLGTLEG